MSWQYLEVEGTGLTLDLRAMRLPDDLPARRDGPIRAALEAMAALEGGAVANPDEGRMVGHYWLRTPGLAPTPDLGDAVLGARAGIARFVERLGGRLPVVLHLGIGGSALGPQLVADALGGPDDARRVVFLDNTDPDGLARLLAGVDLSESLVVVASKSGGTPETRNALRAVEAEFAARGLAFPAHAIAITGEGSALDGHAELNEWLMRFPMWDWVGGRTSLTSAVGLVPMALQGLDGEGLLAGAARMDAATRSADPAANPAALLALAWHDATEGRARRAMVVLPYKDRLALFARYLQQLVMESIGKRLDLEGREVHQGLTVYGNKGSTDQHAYVQQLREGPDDFFATFVEVLDDGPADLEVEAGATAGDYLSGFLAGTRKALAEAGRRSLTVTLDRLDAGRLGALLALYERTVGLYASLVGVNAYHQPGVEAGKKAAAAILDLQRRLVALLTAGERGDAATLAARCGGDPDDAFHVLRHLAANGRAHAEGAGLGRVFSAPRAR